MSREILRLIISVRFCSNYRGNFWETLELSFSVNWHVSWKIIHVALVSEWTRIAEIFFPSLAYFSSFLSCDYNLMTLKRIILMYRSTWSSCLRSYWGCLSSFIDAIFQHTYSCINFLFRYRISGSSLLAAMDQSSQVPYSDVLSVQPSDLPTTHMDGKEQSDGSYVNVNREKLKKNLDSSHSQVNDETVSRVDDRSRRVQPTVDVSEIIRRWTHALQRIHKQSLHLVCSFL